MIIAVVMVSSDYSTLVSDYLPLSPSSSPAFCRLRLDEKDIFQRKEATDPVTDQTTQQTP
jgi:hypothetical protein